MWWPRQRPGAPALPHRQPETIRLTFRGPATAATTGLCNPTTRSARSTLLTVDFRELGPRSTELRLHQEQLLTPEYREGWRLCLDKLEARLRE